jgi:hypothetical protein
MDLSIASNIEGFLTFWQILEVPCSGLMTLEGILAAFVFGSVSEVKL